jgi:uncharacterized LabA/DUF88 family protein
LIRAFYYTAVIEDQEYSSIRPLIDWLDYNGYSVVTKATKEFVDQTGRRKVKGNMDIELAVDAMELAPHIDHMVLFSGDGDFRSLVEAVQRRGVRVTVISTISTQPPMVADELRRQADIFTDIVQMRQQIGRDPSERPARDMSREPRGERQHTPQFLQRGPAPAEPLPVRAPTTISRIDRRFLSALFPVILPVMAGKTAKPGRNCPLCPRLAEFRETWRAREPSWFNAPVPSFGPLDARLLIVGLAPGLRGANRTGRPFTGDYAGDLLYATMKEYGFARGTFEARADDTLELIDARITNGVRCVPPENKPTPAESTPAATSRPHHRGNAKAARHRGARPHRPRTDR